MTTSLILGLWAATMLFWAIGAYNRLVRLRAEVARSFSALDNVLSVQPAVIQASLPVATEPATVVAQVAEEAGAESAAEWTRLQAAGAQFALSLASARSHPLNPGAIGALSAAQSVLDDAWQPSAVVGVLPAGLKSRLAHLADQAVVPADAFDAAVRNYNAAIRQFPALLLAHLWGFKAAATFWRRNLD